MSDQKLYAYELNMLNLKTMSLTEGDLLGKTTILRVSEDSESGAILAHIYPWSGEFAELLDLSVNKMKVMDEERFFAVAKPAASYIIRPPREDLAREVTREEAERMKAESELAGRYPAESSIIH